MTLRRRVRRFLALFQKSRLERELQHEMEAHLELAEADARARGLSARDARRQALLEFGGVEKIREAHREQRSALWLEHLVLDVRYAVGSLRRKPVFTVTVIGVLALGLGANVAMFSIFDQALLRSLPYPEPERMVRVWKEPLPGVINASATLDFEDWKREATSFEALSVRRGTTVSLTGRGEPVRLRGEQVSADFFRVFGVVPAQGRGFLEGEDQAGALPVAILSHASWQSQFGGDAGILGQELTLDGVPHEVVGVLAPGPFDREPSRFWKPLVFTPEQRTRGYMWLQIVGRLRPGVSVASAQEEMSRIDEEVAQLAPPWRRNWTVVVEPFEKRLVETPVRTGILVALGSVGLVLLLTCANVMNLFLARGASRRKELMLRSALGASNWRVMTQLLTEGVVLCVAGGLAGVGLALGLLRLLQPLLVDSLPPSAGLVIDARALVFACLAVLGCALLVSLLPALHSLARSSVRSTALATRSERAGVRGAIVVLEIAGSLVLASAAFLLLKSLLQLQAEDTGFELEQLVTMSLTLPRATYSTPESAAQLAQRLVDEVGAVPGIVSAATTTDLPLRGVTEGQALIQGDDGLSVRFKRIDPGYLETLGIELLSGRGFEWVDVRGAPQVALINEELVQRLADELGIDDPLGRTFPISTPYYLRRDGELAPTRVVGLIKSELLQAGGLANHPTVYVPFAQVPARGLHVIARAQAAPSDLALSLRAAVAEIDPELALGELTTVEEAKRRQLSVPSQAATVVAAFAALAMLLAAMGLYGVLSYSVDQQRQEIGIRMALGARATRVIAGVLRSALTLTTLGLVLGLAGALAMGRAIEGFLFEVRGLDVASLSGAVGVMMGVAFLAAMIPAVRATRVDPVRTLRDEV